MTNIKRYYVSETLGNKYSVVDRLSNSPWGKYFNLSLREADKICKGLNKSGWKLSFWDKIFHSEYDVKEAIKDAKYEDGEIDE